MRKSLLNKFIVLCLLPLFIACKAKRGVVVENQPIQSGGINKNVLLDSLKARQGVFETFNTKADTELSLNNKTYHVTLNIRIKKSEKIWISITALGGLEMARALITPDSLQIMDRINNEHIKKPFTYIQQYSHQQVDYATLESLLIGNCIPLSLNPIYTMVRGKEQAILAGENNGLNFSITLNNLLKPIKTTFMNNTNNQEMSVLINNYEQINQQYFPMGVHINSKTLKYSINSKMEYSKTQLNAPLDFPFNVPKRFSVIE